MGLSKKIAYRIRTLREAAGLSQQEVAERADLSLSLVAKMEQGRKADPRASTILALAAAIGVRPGQIIEDLTAPPEGAFPPKGKKGKKKRKKLLAALVAAVGAGGSAPSTNSSDTAGHDTHDMAVVADALGIRSASDAKEDKEDKKERKRKKKKDH